MDIASETSERSREHNLPARQKSPPNLDPHGEETSIAQERSPKPSTNRTSMLSRLWAMVSCKSVENVSDPNLYQRESPPVASFDAHEQRSSSNESVGFVRQETAKTFRSDSGTYPAVNPPQQQSAPIGEEELALSSSEADLLNVNPITNVSCAEDGFLSLSAEHVDTTGVTTTTQEAVTAIEPLSTAAESRPPAPKRRGSNGKVISGPIRMVSESRVESSHETIGNSSSFILPDSRSLSYSSHTSLERISSGGYVSNGGSPYTSRVNSYEAMPLPLPAYSPYGPYAAPPPVMPVVIDGVVYYPQAQMMSYPPVMPPPHMYHTNNSPPTSFYGPQVSKSPPSGMTRQLSTRQSSSRDVTGSNNNHRSSSAQRSIRRRNSSNNDQHRSSSTGRASSSSHREDLNIAMRMSLQEEEQRRQRAVADEQALHEAIRLSLEHQPSTPSPPPAAGVASRAKKVPSDPRLPPMGTKRSSSGHLGGHV